MNVETTVASSIFAIWISAISAFPLYMAWLFLTSLLVKINTPWRIKKKFYTDKDGEYNQDYKIQQKILGVWITTYWFWYGCDNAEKLVESFQKSRTTSRKTRIVYESNK